MDLRRWTLALAVLSLAVVLPVQAVAAPFLPAPPDTLTGGVTGEAIVKTALQFIGTRYRAGHSGPGGFDCSGLTSYVYKRNNISLTRSSRSQYQEGTPIRSIGDLKKGDLVFFGGSRAVRSVGHVGIVTSVANNGKSFKFVHAARSGVKVDSSADAYYSRRYLGARRIVEK